MKSLLNPLWVIIWRFKIQDVKTQWVLAICNYYFNILYSKPV